MYSKSFATFAIFALASRPASAVPVHKIVREDAAASTNCQAAVTATVTAGNTQVPDVPCAITIAVGTATATASAGTATSTASPSAIGDFGSCSIPQIKFAAGFDNRTETSFEPADQASYPHSSADDVDIITQFMCDQLLNACGADATAQAACASAQTAADTATAKTGAQADKFNAVFGIQTDFAAVTPIDDQGNPVVVTGSAVSSVNSSTAVPTSSTAAPTSSVATAPATTAVAASTSAALTTAAASVASSASSAGTSSTSTSGTNFGTCSTPEISFGAGFDGRKETAFEPTDETFFSHGSADNIGVITSFICNQLTNACGANAAAKTLCTQAEAAAAAQSATSGAAADAFNAVFGVQTDFAAVQEINNEGQVVAGTGSAAFSSKQQAAVITSNATSSSNLQTFTGTLGVPLLR